jgi:hypothetical protein
MVEGQSMTTVADVVARVRDGRVEDFVREAVALVAQELMNAEISAEIGAELGEVAPDQRATHRNGYRPRGWETRVGEIELLVPRKRSGPAYFTSFLEARRPAQQAIVAVVMEAYVNGVSTRKVDRLVEQLGISGMTKDHVSAICRGLDGAPRGVSRAAVGGRLPVPVVRRQVRQGQRSRARRVEGAGGRLCRSGDRGAGGDRPGCRRGRVRQFLGRVPERAEASGAGRGALGDHRSARGAQARGRARAGLPVATLLSALCRPARYADSAWDAAAGSGIGGHGVGIIRRG